MATYSVDLATVNFNLTSYGSSSLVYGTYVAGSGIIYFNLNTTGTTQLGNVYVIFGAYNFGDSSKMETDLNNGDYSKIIGICTVIGSTNSILIYNYNGWKIKQITINDEDITMNDNFSSGVSSLSVTADSGINSILYNSVTYDTFPATIPLSADSVEMSITSKNKTSSRLGGVIRRVKNRISNLCENRMEVAYGVV